MQLHAKTCDDIDQITGKTVNTLKNKQILLKYSENNFDKKIMP